MLGRTKKVHFVGIGGSGMSGIAELLITLGYVVSGSDLRCCETTDLLVSLGATVHEGHDAKFVHNADVVVMSAAIDSTNPEIQEAHRCQIPVIPRAEMLAELMRLRYSIAVAGSHGKTSTASMIAFMLERANLDPTAVIGGRLSSFGSNARVGQGDYMIVEADESDRSFLRLSPSIAVITNVDDEHMESYGTLDHLCDAFVNFANRVPFYGLVAVCADDESLREQASRISRRVRTYGVDAQDADLFAFDIEEQTFGSTCSVSYKPFGERERVLLGTLRLQVPGLHNIRNSLAAMVVGLEIGLNFTQVTATLAEFSGVERRFQRLGEADGVLVVDDYGHHPTEIAAVMHTARQQFKRRMLVVVQPHRFTRVSRLMSQFGSVLAGADEVILTEVYAAGETPMPGATSEVLAEVIGQFSESPVHLVRSLDEVVTRVGQLAKRGDLVITFGAGSISGVAGRIFHHLQQRQRQDADFIEANYG